MKELFEGVKRFSRVDFEASRDLFRTLGEGQSPHTLFIGCSDSRVVPDLITKSLPGDLFVVRNIANVVPYYRVSNEFLSTTAAIEYAVVVLGVKNIVVCGHSNCGGCRSLSLPPEQLAAVPHTRKWLELAREAKAKADEIARGLGGPAEYGWLVEQQNVVVQMNHLLSYPFIAERYEKKSIDLFGWYYDIATGSVFDFDPETRSFDRIE